MFTSQRLRHCAFAAQLGVNALLAGCVVDQPMPTAPVTNYGSEYWTARSCEGVDQPVMQNCLAAHARAGLTQTETIPQLMPSRDEATQALDLMLAETLKDPMSAMQYRVSGVVHCPNIVLGSIVDQTERGCLCYSVNAKNSYGGYTGGDLSVVRIHQIGRGNSFIAQPVEKTLFLSGVLSCPMAPRDADAIRAAVK